MKKLYFLLLTILISTVSLAQEAVITGYADSPCSGAVGRTVEIYVDGTIDFTGWNLQRQSNGGGFGSNMDLSSLGTLTNEFAYITNDSATLSAEFGITTNVVSNSGISSNGDDAFQLVDAAMAVEDRFGEDGVDGTGTAWEHVDTYYYRVDGVPANAGAFDPLDFTFGAQNLLDGTCGTTLGSLVPFGTYTTTMNTTPTVTITGSVSSLDYFEGNGPSTEQSFNVSGLNLTQDITVTAPANFEVADVAAGPYGPSTTVAQTGGSASTTAVYVRLVSGLSANTYSGDITAASMGATDATLALTGTVSPAVPQFSVFGTPGALNYATGSGPSNEESIFVEGLFLTSDITVTAPADFEVSLTTGTGFGPSVTVAQTGGTVANTEVFVRLASGLAVNSYSGDITVSSSPAADQTVALIGNVFGAATNALVLVGAYDGPLPGGTPKGIELVALADIADLSLFGISSVSNGGGSSAGNIEFTFPADAVSAGDRIFVATEATEFTNFFGFAPTYTTGVVGINGDDSIELYEGATIIDTFGDVDTDGSGEAWEYLDGWAYRVTNTGPDGTFVVANWTFSGPNALDGETTNATAATPYPLAVYTNDVLSVNAFNQANFNVYPNPTNTGFVNIATSNNAAINVTVFDILGKQVLKQTLNNTALNVSNLKSGVYILNIKQNDATVTKKLVIQ
ncbi:T9SS type A sorting domain-containing protein [Olleya sp. R77988]|uniref:T9SS type A sorting domain-containing protein n=1 Tax=Olleya sp. R77988 TaxID=3093875 RepID=UPI0037CA4668